MTDLAIFDLTQLSAMTGDDETLAVEVVDIFRAQADVWIVLLDPSAPAPQWADAAHTLKGASLSIGAMRLAKVCETAERAGRSGAGVSKAEAEQLTSAVKAALDEALQAISRWTQDLAGTGARRAS